MWYLILLPSAAVLLLAITLVVAPYFGSGRGKKKKKQQSEPEVLGYGFSVRQNGFIVWTCPNGCGWSIENNKVDPVLEAAYTHRCPPEREDVDEWGIPL